MSNIAHSQHYSGVRMVDCTHTSIMGLAFSLNLSLHVLCNIICTACTVLDCMCACLYACRS